MAASVYNRELIMTNHLGQDLVGGGCTFAGGELQPNDEGEVHAAKLAKEDAAKNTITLLILRGSAPFVADLRHSSQSLRSPSAPPCPG